MTSPQQDFDPRAPGREPGQETATPKPNCAAGSRWAPGEGREVSWASGLFRSRAFPGSLQILVALLFAGVIWLLLFGPSDFRRNAAAIFLWFVWWPLFIIQYFAVGRLWCAVCPFGAAGDLVRHAVGLRLPVPGAVRKYASLVIGALLVLIVWTEEVFHIQENPAATAILLLVVLTAVVVTSAFWEKRAWCRYMCPLGGMGVVYSRAGMLQIRGDQDTCRTCRAVRCYTGTEAVHGCPMHELPRIKESNAYCIFCGNCVKTCPRDSARVEVRAPSGELWLLRRPRFGEAGLAVSLGGVISAVNFMYAVPELELAMDRLGGHMAGFTLYYLGWQVLAFVTMALAALVAARLDRASWKMNFAAFGYAIIPLVLGGHLAHCLLLILRGGWHIEYWFSGWAGMNPHLVRLIEIYARIMPWAQAMLVAGGFVLSIVAATHIARAFFARRGRAMVAALPYAVFFAAVALANGLVHLRKFW